ncbi:MAG: hypothetical protein IKS02_05160 [Fibrobacter sp.]|nr:hypothetical protein [Fibrobacter sp.]
MDSDEQKIKNPSQIIFDNLKELLRAKNAAHESMFKFHWKKMWPFSLIWPQVDFERIVRLMSEIRKNAIIQKNLVLQAKNVAQDFEKDFLNAVPAYLDALDISCQKLSAAAQWKQDMLLKRIHKDVKMRRDVSEYNRILKEYEKAQGDLVRAGAIVQLGWGKVVCRQSAS